MPRRTLPTEEDTMQTIEQIQQQIADHEAPALVATDAGTHSGPSTVDVYQDLDGTVRAVVRTGTSVTSARTIGTSLDGLGATVEALSSHGRMRWIDHETPAARRREIARLRAEIAKRESVSTSEAEARVSRARAILFDGADHLRWQTPARGWATAAATPGMRAMARAREAGIVALREHLGREEMQRRTARIVAELGEGALP